MIAEPGTLGIVVIGRNEGARLAGCLRSIDAMGARIVYVDSGSTDGSADTAAELGADTVELDDRTRFSAARARNAGFAYLSRVLPGLEFVQFVDGDCEIADGWLLSGYRALHRRRDVALVTGHVRERDPDASMYSKLTEMELQGAAGLIDACGGIFMIRASAFMRVEGFDESLVAGEEPDLCLRLRRAGWALIRLDQDMAGHDVGIMHFRQWWRRMLRGGYAYAQGASKHGRKPDRFCVRECISIWAWGLGVPLAALAGAVPTNGVGLCVLALYPLQMARIAVRRWRARRTALKTCVLYAVFCIVAKFPQLLGQIKFIIGRVAGQPASLIEYKGPAARCRHVAGEHEP